MVLSAWLEIEGQLPSTLALIEEIGSGHLENLSASVGGSPAEVGGGCGSPQGQGHWQQKF